MYETREQETTQQLTQGHFWRPLWTSPWELQDLGLFSWYAQSISCQIKLTLLCTGGWDNSVGIATRYGMDAPGIESRWGARFSAPVQTGPGAHLASYTMGTGSFPEVKRPGCGVDHAPPSSAEVKGRVELFLYSFGPSWPIIGWTLTLYSIHRLIYLMEKPCVLCEVWIYSLYKLDYF